ncbi:hypothetical protein HS088_TW04G00984 [Tripterygium wilfordii]|uniref:Transmembrane protein n=2 Tax=Tripterygium wilfordii TaxID=458696 RepID=A0A7J7DRV7_TRIWF|nr:hypothetical protein HS088_TW04G00984 [Tripterygium wilfordii]
MAAILLSCCSICCSAKENPPSQTIFLGAGRRVLRPTNNGSNEFHQTRNPSSSRFFVFAATEGSRKSSKSDEKIPSWARPESEEPPPWAVGEGLNNTTSNPTFEIPFYAYLLASAITAIAAIGSVFEYVNQRPVFGVLGSDSVFYAPLLGFFAFTGIPTSAFLWYKSVQTANKEAEEQDRRDGYRR